MWPWEHLAVGYLAYAALVHARAGRGPTAGEAVAVAFGSQFPDLVDKPLAWEFGVLPAGLSLAHSSLVAGPLSLAVVYVAHRRGRPAVGVAFAVAYLLHLPADALYGVLLGGPPALGFLVWPLVPAPPQPDLGFVERVARLFGGLRLLVASPRGTAYLLAEVVLVGSAAAAWVVDGAPGAGLVRRLLPEPYSR